MTARSVMSGNDAAKRAASIPPIEWPTIETLRDAERLEKLSAVQRHVVEIVRNDGLRRSAEADLVRHHHAEALLAQHSIGPAK